MKRLKFGDFRRFLSANDLISICSYETMEYENYAAIRYVPDTYDDLYVYGVGTIESEFKEEDIFDPAIKRHAMKIGKSTLMARCIEVVFSEKPRRK